MIFLLSGCSNNTDEHLYGTWMSRNGEQYTFHDSGNVYVDDDRMDFVILGENTLFMEDDKGYLSFQYRINGDVLTLTNEDQEEGSFYKS